MISKNKLLEFNTLCKVLGVQLNLRQSGDRWCFVTTLKKELRNLSMNWMNKLFAPRYFPEAKERSLGEGSSLPVHKPSEGSSGGC